MHTTLTINGYELPVHLGWPAAEREQAQTVRVCFTIKFNEPPKACSSDNLEDTFCYDKLLVHLRKKISEKEFRLIEHLAADIHTIMKSQLPINTKITINVLKFPAIAGLTGGVTFTYGDLS